ncbi:SRPBCC family protein [Streptomyces capparidis]
MSEYETTRTFPALPEIVFDEASDLNSLNRWLPGEVHVDPEEPPAATVTVQHGEHAERERALARVRQEQMRVEWGTRDEDRYAGWLQVAGIGPGGSEVTVHLSFFEADAEPPREHVEQALERSLDRLAEQVRLRTETAE